MKAVALSCTKRGDGQYLVVIAQTVGGKNVSTALSSRPIAENTDVIVRDGKVVGS